MSRMARSPEEQDAVEQARLSLLQQMDSVLAAKQMSEAAARRVLYLAEAYAWLTSPSNSHGGHALGGS
jgi:hypothetical protein